MGVRERILTNFSKALDRMAKRGKDELEAQGHKASGRGIESIEGKVSTRTIRVLEGVILGEDYLVPVDTGVEASRIPYSRSGNGGTSKYIEELIRWAGIVKPALSENERKSFAFAVANKHKQEGNPTANSFSFSNNGRRKGWIANAFDTEQAKKEFEKELDLAAILSEEFFKSI